MANFAVMEGAETCAFMNAVSFLTFYVIFSIDFDGYMTYHVSNWCISMKIEGIQTRINENGRIVVPAVIRKAMGLELGDSVDMSLENGVLRIEPIKARIRRVQQSLREEIIPADRLLSDELIAERRKEARSETEEWLG
jgi:AbrB family looped-hinge helix DNA binding protein